MISIFEYKSYRAYLKDYVQDQKTHNSGATLSAIAKKLGFSISGFQMILEGQRSLTVHKIHDIATGLAFSPNEHGFFENLVLFEQAESPHEKKYYQRRMGDDLRNLKTKTIQVSNKDLISDWFVPSLLIYVMDRKLNENFAAKTLGVSKIRITATIAQLEAAGILNLVDGGKVHISFDKVSSRFSKQLFLQKILKIVEQKISKEFSNPDVYFEGHTLSLSESDFQNFKADYRALLERYISGGAENLDDSKVYQTFMSGFPTL